MYTKVIILSSNAKKCPAGSRTFHFQFSLSKTILELSPNHLVDDAGVFFAVGAEQNVLALFEAEASVNVARFDLRKVLVQNFGHGLYKYKKI